MPIFDTISEAFSEEVVYQNPLLFLKIWEISSSPADPNSIPELWPWHYHREVEFLAVLDGGMGVQTKRHYRVLGPGDVMLLGGGQPHRTHKSLPGALRYLVLQIDLGKHFDHSILPYLPGFSELTRPLDDLNYIFEEDERTKRAIHALIADIHKETQERMRGYEMAVSAAIKRMLLLLVRGDVRGALSDAEDADVKRLRPALDYVEAGLGGKLSVDEACGRVNVSYHYFIKMFKRTMGMSFVDYVNYKRIKLAERLLLTSGQPIVDIGVEVGIPNAAQLYKLFKRHNGCSPKEFRQRMRPPAAQQSPYISEDTSPDR
ncbi:AraC family transcriptional regulator [Paenibacillus sp. TRM 82003]|nr:AraC family transcriptional regulator [Paenibacillus sp. TRM 82003]